MAEVIANLVIKKTGEALAVPAIEFLSLGELAINFNDGVLYYRDNLNAIQAIGTKNPASLSRSQTFTGNNIFDGDASFTGLMTVKQVELQIQTLDDGVITWDAADGNLAQVTLTQDSSLDEILNVGAGTYVLKVKQDAIGGHILTFGSAFKSSNGNDPEISADADSVSILTILNTGEADMFIVAQPNFLSFADPVVPGPTDGIPNIVTISGVTGGPPTINGDYDRIADVEGNPAWAQVIDSTNRILIATNPGGYYEITIQDKATTEDPWVPVGDPHYEIATPVNTGGEPGVEPWVNVSSTYTGVASAALTFGQPTYRMLFTGGPSNGTTVDFFQVSQPSMTWYGTDPIPDSYVFRAINTNPDANSSNPYYYLVPRNNDANGEWQVGLYSAGDDFVYELLYHTGTAGPLGTYEDANQPSPINSVVVSAV